MRWFVSTARIASGQVSRLASLTGGLAAAMPRPDGYIVLLDEKGARIIGDGIYFTNEIRLDAKEEFLSVAETRIK
jgi:hypothetical protein